MVVLHMPIVPKPCHLIQTIAYISSADILYIRVQFPNYRARVDKKIKGIYYCPIELIKGLIDKGQFNISQN